MAAILLYTLPSSDLKENAHQPLAKMECLEVLFMYFGLLTLGMRNWEWKRLRYRAANIYAGSL